MPVEYTCLIIGAAHYFLQPIAFGEGGLPRGMPSSLGYFVKPLSNSTCRIMLPIAAFRKESEVKRGNHAGMKTQERNRRLSDLNISLKVEEVDSLPVAAIQSEDIPRLRKEQKRQKV